MAGTTQSHSAPAVETPLRRFCRDFAESRIALLGLAMFAIVLGAALFAPLLSPQNPYDLNQLDIMDGRQPPMTMSMGGFTFWLGSDDQGRDILSALMYGARISLAVGLASVVLSLLVGVSLGLLAGFLGMQSGSSTQGTPLSCN